MENLSKMESFKSFQISKKSMNQIAGSRTVVFTENTQHECMKIVDTNDMIAIKAKVKERYEGKC